MINFKAPLLSFILLFCSSNMLLTSCNKDENAPKPEIQTPKTSIIGHWDFVDSDVSMLVNNMSYSQYLAEELKLSRSAANEIVGQMQEVYLVQGAIDFRTDGTFSQSFDDNITESGKWIIDDNNVLTLKLENEEMKLSIKELTNKTLIVGKTHTKKQDLNDDNKLDNLEVDITNTLSKADNKSKKVYEYNNSRFLK